MNYNNITRKNTSAMILKKKDELDRLEDEYKYKIEKAAKEICDIEGEDYSSRIMLNDYIDYYMDLYKELKWLGKYILEDPIKNEAINFLIKKEIDITKYIPGWMKYENTKMCGDNKDMPMVFEDCKYLWDVFFEYSNGMSRSNIKKTTMWKDTNVRIENEKDAEPKVPEVKDFQNYVKKSETKEIIPADMILPDFSRIKKYLFNSTTSYIDYTHKFDDILNEKDYSKAGNVTLGNVMKIPLRNIYSSYSNVNGSSIYYKTSSSFSITNYKEEQDGIYGRGEKFIDDIYNIFNIGDIYLFTSDDHKSFGFGKITSKQKIKYAERIETRTNGTDPEGNPITYKVYFHKYKLVVNVDFNITSNNKEMKLYIRNSKNIIEDVGHFYFETLNNALKNAKNSYDNANKNMKIISESDEKNYKYFINFLNEVENLDLSNYDNCIKSLNTVINSSSKFINNRTNTILKNMKDDFIPEGIRGIIKDRMDRFSGTLYEWYSNFLLPIVGDFSKFKNKIKNNKFIFRSGILVATPENSIDYTQTKNGGKKLNNPNFIDIPEKEIIYFDNISHFKYGDTIYVIDGINPEIKCNIEKITIWDAVTGTKEINGKTVESTTKVRRIWINRSIPTDVEKYDSLRIVKKI